jgi:hypothetical protein
MATVVSHLGAFTASTFAPNVPLPYWWAYPVLYPAVVVLAVRRGWFTPWSATCAVCLPPAVYFVVIGLADSDWAPATQPSWAWGWRWWSP